MITIKEEVLKEIVKECNQSKIPLSYEESVLVRNAISLTLKKVEMEINTFKDKILNTNTKSKNFIEIPEIEVKWKRNIWLRNFIRH